MHDALSDILALIEMRSIRCTRLEAAGEWAWRFPAKPILKFVAVLKGGCWLILNGEERYRLETGDTFLLANASDYVVASDPGKRPEDGMAAFDWDRSDIARYQGDDTVLLGGGFALEGNNAGLLLDVLPDVMILSAAGPSAAVLHGSLKLLDEEVRAARMGTTLLTHRLADILLVQALRAFVDQGGGGVGGWLAALKDPRLGASINLMHRTPERQWTLRELAAEAGMSRSSYVAHFKEAVGMPPMEYLRRWRMEKARDALRNANTSLADLAHDLGFASESSFGNTFKRVFGHSPRNYWATRDSVLVSS
ncbi:AraC family transcriptional regulator [Mesorhizobium humile]|uniref:AraC family transcriptional regulator n=1 Tax=Mesorhizobium humile TaxID=3072313 RepID=A0ABU4YNH4_9HYPH|nr:MULTISPECIES: AraC family transcriptional regulator [unclassified Mesorhizobium]MDX8463173.1 AraC family transcriptional regulator [Mesorhizobium sp. VK2D]MDX8488546.1 AraC family transcriptional regulator [Mesorhizobium sp. VK2B]